MRLARFGLSIGCPRLPARLAVLRGFVLGGFGGHSPPYESCQSPVVRASIIGASLGRAVKATFFHPCCAFHVKRLQTICMCAAACLGRCDSAALDSPKRERPHK
ncbi:MAG: hypothetical protein DCC68_04170 [Planctomycetota bacterium]|nr:MAG: hypothetical protein DCC68_04170 [Planctomycetota bacterium]